MKIEYLKLRGFIGIKDRMGLDEIEIDFSTLSGLTAFAGPNGMGKTTVLENLHPFRTLVSRSGALQHHVFLRDAFRDLRFTHHGHHYRCLINIDSHTGKQDCFIYKDHAQASQVDGKTANYDRYIEKLFGSSNLYFNSVFCAQGSDKLSDMTTGDLKALFAEFLQLDKLVQWEKTAKEIRDSCSSKCTTLERKILDLDEQLQSTDKMVEEQLAHITGLLSRLKEESKLLSSRSSRIDTKIAELKKSEEINAVIYQQIQSLNQRIKGYQDELAVMNQTYLGQQADRKDESRRLKKKMAAAEGLIDEKPAILSRLEQTQVWAAQKDELAGNLAKAEAELGSHIDQIMAVQADDIERESQYRKDCDALRAKKDGLQVEIDTLNREVSELNARVREAETDPRFFQLKSQIAACHEKMADLDLRDPACQSTTCAFIVGALKAQKQKPILEAQLKQVTEENKAAIATAAEKINQIKTAEKEKAAAINDLTARMSKRAQINNEHADSNKARLEAITAQRCQADAAVKELKTALDAAQTSAQGIPALNAKLSEIQQAQDQLNELAADVVKLETSARRACQVHAAIVQRYQATIASAQKEIQELNQKIVKDAAGAITTLLQEKRKITGRIPENQKELEAAHTKAGEIQAAQDRTAQQKARLEKLKEAHGQLFKMSNEWDYLRAACSKDGLRALEIDSVAPTVSKDANDLLFNAFGPQDPVKLRTQDPETGRECLDILIERSDGTEVMLDNLSGGQKVWYLKALRLALTLMSKNKTGCRINTAMVDEEDGALDDDNAKNFIGMYRCFMDTGKFEDCFYISHKSGCVQMADNIVAFGPGGVTIN